MVGFFFLFFFLLFCFYDLILGKSYYFLGMAGDPIYVLVMTEIEVIVVLQFL